MAKSIIEVSNYIVVDYGQPFNLLAFPKTSVYSETANSFELRVRPREDVIEIQFSEVGNWYTDATHTTAFTVETLRTFFREFTTGRKRRNSDRVRVLYRDRVLEAGGIVEALECIPENTGASFLLSPSGYSDGKVYTALPEDGSGDMDFARASGGTRINAQGEIENVNTLGDELVTNGTFETILGDDLFSPTIFYGNSNSVTDGVYEVTLSSSNNGFQMSPFPYELGVNYKIEWEVIETTLTAGTFAVWGGGSDSTTFFGDLTQVGNTGTIYKEGIATQNGDIRGNNLSTGTIKFRLTIKEVTEGYIDDTELVTNGGFDTDLSGWTNSAGATWFQGSSKFENTNGAFAQSTLDVGKTYYLTVDVTVDSGSFLLFLGGGSSLNINSSGTYTYINTSVNATLNIFSANFTGSIDNISVKEVVQDNWSTSGADFLTISDGKANFLDCPSGRVIYQDNLLTIGKTYKVTFEVSNLILGGFRLESNPEPISRYSNGIYTETFIATISRLHIRTLGTTTGSIDNISVKEVIEEGIPRLNYDDIEYQDVLGAELVSNGDFETGEIGSTNLISDSNSYTGNIIYYTQTPNQSSPDGLNNATLFTEKTNTAFHTVGSLSAVATGGQTYTYSFFVKYNGVQYITVNATDGVSGFIADLDILNGTVVAGTAQSTTRIEEYEDGWWRVSIVRTIGATASIAQISFNFGVRTGDGVSGFYLFGYQIEQLPYATSYIPTNGSIQSRVNTTDWTIGTGWRIEDGAASIDGTTGYIYSLPSNLEAGKTYQMTYSITDYTSGRVKIRCGGTDGTFRGAVGTYTEILDYAGSTFTSNLYSDSFIGSIDNISVKEVLGQEIVSSGCPSLLLEPQSTNLIEYSEDFSQPAPHWISVQSAIEGGYSSPDGGNNAYKLIENTTALEHAIYSNTGTLTGDKTGSVYVKNAGADVVTIKLHSTIAGRFDLSTKTVLVESNCSLSWVEEEGGWFRISVTSSVDSTYMWIATDNSLGNGTDGIYIYGAQLEALPYATSYIPTSGGIATRVAETLERDNISHLINSEEGVLYFEGSILDTSYISLRDSSSTSTFASINFYKTVIQSELNVSGVSNSKINHSGSFDGDYKIALAYTSSEMSLYVNGSFIETKAAPQIPLNSLDELHIPYKGKVKDLRIYKTALTDQELENITSL